MDTKRDPKRIGLYERVPIAGVVDTCESCRLAYFLSDAPRYTIRLTCPESLSREGLQLVMTLPLSSFFL